MKWREQGVGFSDVEVRCFRDFLLSLLGSSEQHAVGYLESK